MGALAATALLTTVSVMVVAATRSALEYDDAVTRQTARNAERTAYQQVAAYGLDPAKLGANNTMADVATLAPTSDSDLGEVTRAGVVRSTGMAVQVGVGSDAGADNRARGMGLQLRTDVTAKAETLRTLQPPTFSLANGAVPAIFPLAGLVVASPANPASTVYKFATNGSDPGTPSESWYAKTFTVADYPAVLKVRAYSSDPTWSPSSVATLTLSYPSPTCDWSRQDGSTATTWNWFQVMDATNGWKLDYDATYWTVEASINGGPWTSVGAGGIVHPEVSHFTPDSGLRWKVLPKNNNFSTAGTVGDKTITAVPLTLPNVSGMSL